MAFWKQTDDGRRLLGPLNEELWTALVAASNRNETTVIGYITALVERDKENI